MPRTRPSVSTVSALMPLGEGGLDALEHLLAAALAEGGGDVPERRRRSRPRRRRAALGRRGGPGGAAADDGGAPRAVEVRPAVPGGNLGVYGGVDLREDRAGQAVGDAGDEVPAGGAVLEGVRRT